MRGLIYIPVFIITLMYIPFSFACHDEPNRPSGEEIVCPAEKRHATQDLKEKGLGIADMPIIDELACRVTDDEARVRIHGWCEHRKADKNPLIYIVVYSNQNRDMVRLILIHDPKTNKKVVFYDSEKKVDI